MLLEVIVMETTVTRDATPRMTDAEYEAIVDQNLARLKLMQQKMDEEQREIEMLRAENDSILSNIMRTLKAV